MKADHKYKTRSKAKENENPEPPDEPEEEEDEMESFDVEQYRKMLLKLFPSKHLKEKVDAKASSSKKATDEDSDEDEETDNDEIEKLLNGKGKMNIVLTIGDVDEEEDEDEDSDEDSDSDSDSESESDDESEEEEAAKKEEEEESEDEEGIQCNMAAIKKIRDVADQFTESEMNSSLMKKLLKQVDAEDKKRKKEEKKKTKKERTKNTVKLKKLLKEKNMMDDARFFKDTLTVQEQAEVLEKVEQLNEHYHIKKPYRLSILDTDIPMNYKALAFHKVNSLGDMDPGSGEYYKMKNWVDTFMKLPFGNYAKLPITIDDGQEKCHEFMANGKATLDSAVYGLNDAKMQVMQMMGQWIANPSAMGTAIAIKGPMGTGKTTLVKEGISKILNREFAFIALGGATDSSFLEGHSYTYEGSTWGKIVETLIQCKTMNPVIFFDELDKVSDTPKGEEIIGILTHLTDASQNSKFHDKYFSELDFDMSRCLFIFSYNDESAVNPILRDRMYRIQTKGYDQKEKTTIAQKYLIPAIQEQVKFTENDITIPESTIHYLIEKHTDKEEGVRNLKRCIEVIHTKLNLYRLMIPGTNLFEEDLTLDIKFPVTVTKDMIDKLFKQNKDTNESFMHMYM
jgi:ATP-dependent Lon protease